MLARRGEGAGEEDAVRADGVGEEGGEREGGEERGGGGELTAQRACSLRQPSTVCIAAYARSVPVLAA
eukprot:3109407-Rhodomonas_salina.1